MTFEVLYPLGSERIRETARRCFASVQTSSSPHAVERTNEKPSHAFARWLFLPPSPPSNLFPLKKYRTPPLSGSWALFYILEAVAVISVLRKFPNDRAAAVSIVFFFEF